MMQFNQSGTHVVERQPSNMLSLVGILLLVFLATVMTSALYVELHSDPPVNHYDLSCRELYFTILDYMIVAYSSESAYTALGYGYILAAYSDVFRIKGCGDPTLIAIPDGYRLG